jgi:hypothetical protein
MWRVRYEKEHRRARNGPIDGQAGVPGPQMGCYGRVGRVKGLIEACGCLQGLRGKYKGHNSHLQGPEKESAQLV